MQDFTDDETWANQIGSLPALSMRPNPNEGLGGAEAGISSIEPIPFDSDASTQAILGFTAPISPYSHRWLGQGQDNCVTSSTELELATSQYFLVGHNDAIGHNDAQGPALSTSPYVPPFAYSLVGSPPVPHPFTSPPAGFHSCPVDSSPREECGLPDAQSHSGYYYNEVADQQRPLTNVGPAHCHDSGCNNNTALTCTVSNQTQFQDLQTFGLNLYSEPSTNFGESASFGYASQPYEDMPDPDLYDGNHLDNQTFFGGLNPAIQSLQASPSMPNRAPVLIQCSVVDCSATFKREPDRLRHAAAVHGINQLLQLYLCPVIGCSKSQGSGYTRKDKLTEHLWKKHGNLGYAKRV